MLCGWCLLATLAGIIFSPHAAFCSQTTIELAAAVAPTAVDFSDTALQQNCHGLVKSNLQAKTHVRTANLLANTRLIVEFRSLPAQDVRLPDVDSLLTLGIALLL